MNVNEDRLNTDKIKRRQTNCLKNQEDCIEADSAIDTKTCILLTIMSELHNAMGCVFVDRLRDVCVERDIAAHFTRLEKITI